MSMKDKNPAKKIKYSGTEFGAILEAIHKDVKTIAEGHSGLEKGIEELKVGLHGNSRRLDSVEFSTRVTSDRVGRLEDAVSLLSKELKDTKSELKSDIEKTRTELKNDIKDLGTRMTTVESGR